MGWWQVVGWGWGGERGAGRCGVGFFFGGGGFRALKKSLEGLSSFFFFSSGKPGTGWVRGHQEGKPSLSHERMGQVRTF